MLWSLKTNAFIGGMPWSFVAMNGEPVSAVGGLAPVTGSW